MRFILGVVLAGAALFLFGFVYWTIAPFTNMVIQSVEADEEVAASLATNLGKSGVFMAPMPPRDTTDVAAVEAWGERHRQGPVYMLFYDHDGKEPMSKTTLAMGFGHAVLVAFIGGLVLLAASPRSYMTRVMLVLWTAVLGTVWADLGNVLWWHFPQNYCWLQMGYHVLGGLVLGVVLAAFIRPDPEVA